MLWDELFKIMSEMYLNDENDFFIYDLVYGVLLYVVRYDGYLEEKFDVVYGLRESVWCFDCVVRWLVFLICIFLKFFFYVNEIFCFVRDNKC